MQGKSFLYFLQGADERFATFTNGFLEWAGTPTPIEFTPDGWQDISILTEKNKAYFGLDRTYGAPQNFVEDGANIIKSIFYNQGIEEVLYLVILEQQLFFDDVSYGYYYSLLCKCEIDLSTTEHDAEKVTEAILEGDIAKYIKANENTTYDISLDVPAAVNILADGLNLYSTAHYVNPTITLPGTGPQSGQIPWTFTNKEGDQVNILNQSSPGGPGRIPFIESVKGTNTAQIQGTIKWGVKNATSLVITLLKVKDNVDGAVINQWVLGQPPIGGGGSGSGEIDFNYSVTLLEGEGLYFRYLLVATSPHANTEVSFEQTNMDASYSTRLAPTLMKALPPLYLFQQIVSSMTGGKYTPDSTLLKNLDPFILFTSGDGIRQIPGAYIKTSLKSFFNFMNMRYCVGMGIVNGILVMERKQFWCNNSNIIPVFNASGLKVSISTDYLFSNFNIGYPNKLDNAALGDINGRYEFCMTHTYTAPVLRSQNTLDLTTEYCAGMYVIENTRLNSAGKTTTDGDSDNDTFVLNTLPTPTGGGVVTIPVITGGSVTIALPEYYELDRSINASSTGLLDQASAFNLKLSPKQCLYANGAYLRSCLTNLDSKKIVFTTADKNVNLTVNVGGKVIDERGNVSVSDLDPAFFKYYQLEFTCEPPETTLLANPIRKFSFEYGAQEIELSGFDIKTSTQPSDNRQQVFTLLAAADCDVTPLVNVNE